MFTEDETIMNHKLLITLLLASFLFAACAPGGATPTAEAIPTVIADSTIIAEGRLEPIRFARSPSLPAAASAMCSSRKGLW